MSDLFDRDVGLATRAAVEGSRNYIVGKQFLNPQRPSMRRDDASTYSICCWRRDDAIEFDTKLTCPPFECERMHQLSILKAVETIGEAVSQVSNGAKEAHPEIPQQETVGMRNSPRSCLFWD